MSFNLLHVVKPLVPYIPDVQSPSRTITFHERFIWTTLAILIYLVSSQVPLFGIISNDAADPLQWMRAMMASNRGTLMDLGTSPVVTSSLIMQFLTMSEILKVDWSIKEDKNLHNATQRLISLIMTVGQAFVQVYTGFYGSPKSLGTIYCLLLVMQLIFSGVIIILLDELLQKGYGLGNGVNLFIATNVCESIVWKAFSPKVLFTGRGIEFEGSVIALFHLLVVRKNKFAAIYEAFFRQNLPNLFSLLSTVLLFTLVIYLQGIRVELPTESSQVRGHVAKFPIKLLYTSTMPIIAQNYIVGHISSISSFLYRRWPQNLVVKILGVWNTSKGGRYMPVSGISYYITSPESILEGLRDPLRFFAYLSIMLLTSAILSTSWLELNELSPEKAAQKLKESRMRLKGVREASTATVLSRYIPTAAFLGGILTSMVVILSNLFDAIGSGTNIFLATSIVNQYLDMFAKETTQKNSEIGFIE
ncbi:protein transport protein Sec61 subunit alpha [Encephalitozoon romaleae SJ-2008]|uniref:Protein transport protein Sec61 subunit alpha n=1 Tax=Encephalitozoon romaleae (strain SJ-2008) TaxID=1178016 RepID=I7AP94_ENCRO|nr:protein transport protein Sec61 subunit alpha [Encephalitozoon romaleae SJ-2008]AFN83629.1 protein transport protein Sec61 subunit alpha [Encephalitozoon romaleae SJ-2008]